MRACARGEVDANSAPARVRSRWRIGCGNGPAVLVSRFREAVRCARTREARRRMSSTGSSRMDMTARCSLGRDAAARVPSRSRIGLRDGVWRCERSQVRLAACAPCHPTSARPREPARDDRLPTRDRQRGDHQCRPCPHGTDDARQCCSRPLNPRPTVRPRPSKRGRATPSRRERQPARFRYRALLRFVLSERLQLGHEHARIDAKGAATTRLEAGSQGLACPGQAPPCDHRGAVRAVKPQAARCRGVIQAPPTARVGSRW